MIEVIDVVVIDVRMLSGRLGIYIDEKEAMLLWGNSNRCLVCPRLVESQERQGSKLLRSDVYGVQDYNSYEENGGELDHLRRTALTDIIMCILETTSWSNRIHSDLLRPCSTLLRLDSSYCKMRYSARFLNFLKAG